MRIYFILHSKPTDPETTSDDFNRFIETLNDASRLYMFCESLVFILCRGIIRCDLICAERFIIHHAYGKLICKKEQASFVLTSWNPQETSRKERVYGYRSKANRYPVVTPHKYKTSYYYFFLETRRSRV